MKDNFSERIHQEVWPVAGMVPMTTTDFPGKLSAVLFTSGCAWRCEYCHNPHLWEFNSKGTFSVADFKNFLKSRQGLLDAVVISGGEATLHACLKDMISMIKDYGFEVGLHSAGINPWIFEKILSRVDWVGFDFKTVWRDYDKITRSPSSGNRAQISLHELLHSEIDYEIRTTLHRKWHSEVILVEMSEILQEQGAKNWILQEFRSEGCSSADLKDTKQALDNYISPALLERIKGGFRHFDVRRS